MYFDKDLVKQSLTVKDIIKLMKELGSAPPIPDRNGNPRFQTICHNMPSKNNKFKLYYYDNTKLFTCYTGCGERFDIFELIAKVMYLQKGVEYELNDCINFVAEHLDKDFDFADDSFLIKKESSIAEDWDFINKQLKIIRENMWNEEVELRVYSKYILKLYKNYYYTGWIKEGISIEAMKKFSIGLHIPTERITIPYFDIEGNLIGVRGRALNEIDVMNGAKYMPMKHNGEYLTFPMSAVMYGLYQNKETIKRLKKAILFEAEKSVLQLESFYPNNNIGLGLGGSNLFDNHVKILLNLGVEEVYVALDKEYNKYEDDKYLSEHTLKVKEIVDKLKRYFKVYIVEDTKGLLDYKDSPTDKGEITFSNLVKEAKERKR